MQYSHLLKRLLAINQDNELSELFVKDPSFSQSDRHSKMKTNVHFFGFFD